MLKPSTKAIKKKDIKKYSLLNDHFGVQSNLHYLNLRVLYYFQLFFAKSQSRVYKHNRKHYIFEEFHDNSLFISINGCRRHTFGIGRSAISQDASDEWKHGVIGIDDRYDRSYQVNQQSD